VFFYFRAVPEDNTIVWGGRTGHLAGPDSPRAYAHLARDMLQTFPQLAPYAITHGWSGQIGYTFDELPHLGATPSGIHYAMGYCGTGVSRSTWFGHQIALQVMGDKQGRTAFDDIAFPSHAFHAFAPAMVPAVATWYRIRDSANF
jgi:glycine/D-amino acid oxidase-like deaminating enzyme